MLCLVSGIYLVITMTPEMAIDPNKKVVTAAASHHSSATLQTCLTTYFVQISKV